MNWLEELVHQHSQLESPLTFWKWAGLAAISAVLRDNVWIDRAGVYKLYPNIYVMLHADSGLKKGPPVGMAKKLVQLVSNTRVISGRSSIQGILKEMGTVKTQPGGHIDKKSSTFICSSELTSSIVDDPAALEILTDIYDRNYNEGEWKSLLKSESFTITSPVVTMLTATNEAHADEFFIKKDIQGGYIARTFIIYEKKRNRKNSLMYDGGTRPDYVKSALYLKELSKLHGEIIIDEAGKKYYDEWYNEFLDSVDNSGYTDATGTLNRFGDSVLKVALLLALADRPELVIEEKHLVASVSQCEKLIGNVRKTTMGQGKSSFAAHKGLLINELLNRTPHEISRTQLNKKYYLHASAQEWDEIVKDLAAADMLYVEMRGANVMIAMSDERAKEWIKHLEGKK